MKHSFVSLVILAVGGCSMAVGQDATMAGKLNSTDAQFVRDAMASGRHEIQMSQMALKQSTNPQVMSLAQRLISDHTAASKRLEQIAGSAAPAPESVPATIADIQSDIENRKKDSSAPQNGNSAEQPARPAVAQSTAPASAATDDHSHVDGRMETMRGADFDKAWAKQMVENHKAAIAKFEMEEKEAMNADLRAFITSTLPTLRDHLSQAQALDK